MVIKMKKEECKMVSSLLFISRLSMIVRVTDVSTTCAVVIFRVKVSSITSVDGF